MRLVDADILLKEGWVLHKMVGTTLHEMPLNHPDVPTVDVDSLNAAHEDIGYEKGYRDGYACAMEDNAKLTIVRCKDCKYGEPNGYGCKCYHYKLYETHEMSPNDFCSRAERREDGDSN